MVAGVAGVGAAGAFASVRPTLSPVSVVDAATFLASAALVFFMRSAPTLRVESAGTFHEPKAGLRVVLGSRVLAAVVATGWWRCSASAR